MADSVVADQNAAPSEPQEPSVTLAEPETAALDAPAPEEQRARDLGWVPQDEWRGPADKWRPANDFLAFHSARMPGLRQENLRLQTQMEELRAEIAALKGAERERQDAAQKLRVDGLKFERKQALDSGDNDRLTQIDDELIAARANEAVAKVTQVKTQNEQRQQQAMAIWQDFLADGNEWANNEEMAQLLITETAIVKQGNPQLAPRAVLERAKDRVQRFYPEKFDRRQRSPQPSGMVDMGGYNGAARSNVRTWNDLVPEVRQMFDTVIDHDPVMRKDVNAARANILKNCAVSPDQYFRR